MLHNASLLIDDIEDNSVLRRGIPVAHNIFGVGSTINSANYVYFLSLEKTIKELPSDLVSKAVLIFTEQLLELHRGQGLCPLFVPQLIRSTDPKGWTFIGETHSSVQLKSNTCKWLEEKRADSSA